MPRKRREIPWLEVRDEVYYVYWYDAASRKTKRISLHTKDRVEATRAFAAFLTEGHEICRAGDDKSPPGLKVATALEDYFREHVTQRVVDKGRQEDAINHLKAYFGRNLLREIDIPSSRGYADARRAGLIGGGPRCKDPCGSDGTIRRELVVLRAAAHHALRWKRITANDMPSVEMPPDNPGEATWLTREELQQALAEATGKLKDFMLLAYYTGARRRSVEGLTRFQVDLKAGHINLRSPTEDANRRRSKKRRPVVPIDPRLRPTVERLMAADPTVPWLLGDNKDVYDRFRTHMERLGLAGKAHPHVLRHSRATHLLQDGVSIYAVAKLLGDTVKTVERVYGHHSTEYLAQAIQEPQHALESSERRKGFYDD